jgi:hypothetical protein
VNTVQSERETKTVELPFIERDGYYEGYLFLIDILGFSTYIQEAAFEDVKDIFNALEDRIHDGCIVYSMYPSEYEKAIRGESWTGGKSYKPAFTVFSDTILMGIPDHALFRDQNNAFDLPELMWKKKERSHLLMQLTLRAAELQLSLLELGFLSRGAITFGSLYNKGNIWFGVPIVEAHQLEKSEGNYAPRIILSDGVIENLEIEKYFADNVTPSFVLKDTEDQKIYCDYLAHSGTSGISNEHKERMNKIHNIIEKNISSFKNDDRIRKKWEWAKRG